LDVSGRAVFRPHRASRRVGRQRDWRDARLRLRIPRLSATEAELRQRAVTEPGAHDTDMIDVARQMTETSQWLDRFRERHGRAPTVLHIGNIANAAYLNARMLNEAGIDCDVLCYEYYHIMGCPEWESAVFDPNGVNPDRPLWSEIDLQG